MLLAAALSLLLNAPDAGTPLLARPVTISADKLDVYKKENRAHYEGRAKAIRDTLTLTCDVLDVFLAPGGDVTRIVARGNVVAVDGDREAHGDEAEFFNDTGVLTLKGKPWGRQGAREVDGELVTFVTGVDKLTVTRAHTRVKEPKDQRLTIDADLLTFEVPKNEAKWTGHVKAVKGKTTLVAPELVAISDATSGEVTRVKARGGIEVTEGDRWARGQFGDYDVPASRLVVTGNPEARDGRTRMKGTKVTFLSGTEFLEVENATTVITQPPSKKGP
ncbi:MAG: LptA/OstA family protein [Archangium sp.]